MEEPSALKPGAPMIIVLYFLSPQKTNLNLNFLYFLEKINIPSSIEKTDSLAHEISNTWSKKLMLVFIWMNG